MHLSLVDYWFLDALAEFQVPVYLLSASAEVIQEQWNRHPHRLGRDGAIQRLIQLWHAKLVDWGTIVSDQMSAYVGDPSAIDVDAFQSGCVGLTESGGAMWESWAEPDWCRFLVEKYDYEIDKSGGYGPSGLLEIRAGSRMRLDEALETGGYHWHVRMDRTSARFGVWEVAPFDATYWKTLVRGFNCVVPFADDSEERHATDTSFWRWTRRGFNKSKCSEAFVP